MDNLHSYSLADLKYNLKRSKSKKYSRFLKKNIKTQKGSGEHIGNNNKHMFDIEDVYDADDQIRKIFIGKSDANMCIVGMIFDSTPDEIVIDNFNYKQTCNLTADLERVTGVKKMMKTYLKYVKQKYPVLTKATLSDKATFNCIDAITNSLEKISLYKLYLIKYKSPYYVRNHEFLFMKEDELIKHTDNLSIINKDSINFNYNKFIAYLEHYKILLPANIQECFISEKIDDSQYTCDNIKLIITHLTEQKYCKILNYLLDYIFDINTLKKLSGAVYYKDL